MGQLSHFDVERIARENNLTVFIETGTGSGDSLAHALGTGIFVDGLFSIEVWPEIYFAASKRFVLDRDVYVMPGTSEAVLPGLLGIIKQSHGVLFWLDAHFPGGDYGLAEYGSEARDDIRMPLKEELRLIQRLRLGARRDVILVDDARLFCDGPFGSGILPPQYKPLVPVGLMGFEWIEEMWRDSHDLLIDWSDHGYLILTPKGD